LVEVSAGEQIDRKRQPAGHLPDRSTAHRIDASEHVAATARYCANPAIDSLDTTRAYRFGTVAVGRPERGSIRTKEVGQRPQKRTIVVIAGTNASDQMNGRSSGCRRSRAAGTVSAFGSFRSKREIDENGQRPLRELLRQRLLEGETRILQ
jgi:hypothetical protein